MKRILVTGGAGFLGSNLCNELIKDGNNQVLAMDNLFTGRLKNLSSALHNTNFDFFEGDIIDSAQVESAIDKLGGVDEIYNMACPASPPAYQKSPTNTIKTNVIGIMNLLDISTKYNSKLLQSSTSEVYGDPLVHPQIESYRGNVNPIGIRACYDEGKRCAETLCFDYNREFGTKIKVIRIFNTYGPNMDPKDGRVVSNFILQALNNEAITVYGDGKQTRSFCYVDDLIAGMISMMNSPDDFHGPVNLGNPGEFTMLELADKVISMTNSKSEILFCGLRKDDPTQRKPVIELAYEKLGWKPMIGLDEGLMRTIDYYRNILEEIIRQKIS